MARLITRSQLARLAGVTGAAITKACNKSLAPACKGKRVDEDHPAVQAYLVAHDPLVAAKPGAPPSRPRGHAAKNARRKRESLAAITDHPIPDDLSEFIGMTLGELISQFGHDYAFVDWLKAVKLIEDITTKRIQNAEKVGELVNRELVRRSILEPIDSAHLQIMTDGAKTMARRVTALHDAGEPVEAIEKFISEQIGSFIKPVKAKISRVLIDAF